MKDSLINPPFLEHPNYQIPFFLSVHEKEGNALGVLTQKHGDQHRPLGYYSQQLDTVAHGYPPCLRAVAATALLVKATEKIVTGSPLTIFVPHAVKGLLNSCHTQHLSVSHLTSYEILLLSASHITLSHCNNLNPATLLPSETMEAPHDCLTLTDHLLAPCDDVQKTPLGKANFLWFTDGFY